MKDCDLRFLSPFLVQKKSLSINSANQGPPVFFISVSQKMKEIKLV